jgi:LysR family nitrogen assimilation transcriptional regulator
LSAASHQREKSNIEYMDRLAPCKANTNGTFSPLTEFGARAATRLRMWLQQSEQVMDELRVESGALLGDVRLGIVPSAAHPLMTRLFQRLQAEHAGIRLNIAEAQGAELDAMLDSATVDLAVLFRYQRPSGREEKLLGVTLHTTAQCS